MNRGKAITGVLFSAILALSLVGSAGDALAATSEGGGGAHAVALRPASSSDGNGVLGVTWDCSTFRGMRCPLGWEGGNGPTRS